MGDLVKVNDVCKQLGVELRTVRSWVRRGFLPCTKIGRCNYVRRSDFDNLLAQFDTVCGYEKLLKQTAIEQQRLLEEYRQNIRQVQEDMLLVSTMGHVLNTKQLFLAAIQSSTLSKSESDVLTLMIEGYSFSDIAKRLHITHQAARQRFSRALEAMQSFPQSVSLIQENNRLKQETSASNKLIERLLAENNQYRSGNITATSSADYVFTMYHFLKRRIKRADFSTRTYNALCNAKILYMEDLLKMQMKDIVKIRGIRWKCYEEIKAYASRLGLSLGFNVEEINKQYKQIYGQVS